MATAKLAARIDSGTPDAAFAGRLVVQAAQPEDEEFIEVQVCGPISRRTLERVILLQRPTRVASRAIVRALREKLTQVGATLEERP